MTACVARAVVPEPPPRQAGSGRHDHLWFLPDGTGLHAPVGSLATEEETGRLCCHLCGRWFTALGAHVRVHGYTAGTYRQAMRLRPDQALTVTQRPAPAALAPARSPVTTAPAGPRTPGGRPAPTTAARVSYGRTGLRRFVGWTLILPSQAALQEQGRSHQARGADTAGTSRRYATDRAWLAQVTIRSTAAAATEAGTQPVRSR